MESYVGADPDKKVRGTTMLKLRNDLFRSEMKEAIRLSFLSLQERLTGERLYGFSLHLGALGSFVGACGNTEEGLGRVVDVYRQRGHYQAKKGDLTTHLHMMLRWSCADGWLFVHDPYFTNANQLLHVSYESDPDVFYESGVTRLVYLECLAALADNDADGLFGRGQERETLTLNLYLGDQSDDDLLRWACQVNPDVVHARYRAELAAGHAAEEGLTYTSRTDRRADHL
jgi:hypothetical protein